MKVDLAEGKAKTIGRTKTCLGTALYCEQKEEKASVSIVFVYSVRIVHRAPFGADTLTYQHAIASREIR
jgi:hypothetical protein